MEICVHLRSETLLAHWQTDNFSLLSLQIPHRGHLPTQNFFSDTPEYVLLVSQGLWVDGGAVDFLCSCLPTGGSCNPSSALLREKSGAESETRNRKTKILRLFSVKIPYLICLLKHKINRNNQICLVAFENLTIVPYLNNFYKKQIFIRGDAENVFLVD